MSVVSRSQTVTPSTASEAAAFLQQAARDGTRVMPVGCRRRLRLEEQSSRLIALSCCGLTAGFAHYAGDLVATVPAGLTLSAATVIVLLVTVVFGWIAFNRPQTRVAP